LAIPGELCFHASDETENFRSSKDGSTLQRFYDSTRGRFDIWHSSF